MRAALPLSFWLLLLLALAGCGGGGGNDDDIVPGELNGTPTPIVTQVATPAPSATAAPAAGTLDARFGTNGLVVLTEKQDARVPRHGLRVLSDGSTEVLLVTRSALLHRSQVTLLRITPDGQQTSRTDLDALIAAEEAAFGTNGEIWVAGVFAGLTTMTRFARGAGVMPEIRTQLALSTVADIVPLAEGGVLAAGSARRRGGLQRLDADGVIDRSFGTDGLVIDPDPADADVTFFAADGGMDGRIVAVGTHLVPGAFAFMPFVASYDATGHPIPTFGGGGMALVVNGGQPNDAFAAVAAAPDGGVIVGTSADVSRLDPTGIRDKAFDRRVDPESRLDGTGSALLFSATGDLTVVGTTEVLDPEIPTCALSTTGAECYRRTATVTRLGSDGTPDQRFGTGGTVVTDFRAPDYSPGAGYTALVLGPAGYITVAGNTRRLPTASGIVVARYLDVAQ